MRDFLRKLVFPKQVEIEQEILALSDKLKDTLLPQDIQNIKDDVEHNEFGNAFETLCVQLFEYESPISQEIYTKIENVGREIGYAENKWNFLKTLIKDD